MIKVSTRHFLVSIVFFSLQLLAASGVMAQTPNPSLIYGPPPQGMGYFGACVLHEPGWDRYLMYLSINGHVADGKPSMNLPGDPGTFNDQCGGWSADRIWLTWHFGDGIDPHGWDADDGYGNKPPFLMLDIGGPGESALIGDPHVVYWSGKWHMYYEGTDRCDGLSNRIFHATASHWMGPWNKRGEVQGLWGITSGSGLSWPTVLIDDGELILYFTDGAVHLLAAMALDSSGHNFVMLNWDGGKPLSQNNPAPVIHDTVNRGHVIFHDGKYQLVYDNFGRTEIKISTSQNKLSFPAGSTILKADATDASWRNFRNGLPFQLASGGTQRIYFTGEGSEVAGSIGSVSMGDIPELGLRHLLAVLQILSGNPPSNGDTNLDLTGNDKIGIEDAIFIQQVIVNREKMVPSPVPP